MLKGLRRAAEQRKTASSLAVEIVRRSLSAEFFRDLGVPDTFNGRFDMVALHAWLVLERLEGEGARPVSQDLVNALFYSFEDALRDQGAGDMGMTRRIKKIANAFYGRLGAYREAGSQEALAAAILRNAFNGEAHHAGAADRLAGYAFGVRARLAASSPASGQLDFGPPPTGGRCGE